MDRRRLGSRALRLVSALALLVAVLGFFRQPLAHSVFPGVFPGLERWAAEAGIGALGPAPGFLLRADSVPPGGTLFVDGEPRGTLPFFGNVICRAGDEVRLEVRLDGYQPWVRTVDCREGGRLQLTARLER